MGLGIRLFKVALCAFILLLVAGCSTAMAQDDEPSLGDLARNLRQKKAEAEQQKQHAIIDNDNLPQAMEDVRSLRPNRQVVTADPSGRGFKMTAPDISCNLTFSGRTASSLVQPVLIEDVPTGELAKLDGPASIQDDSLQVEVFNGTDWELREITVGITLERKAGLNAELAARARVIPAAENTNLPAVERHSDVTVLYHLKASAKPYTTATFRENIGVTPGPDQEWRWSIVEAKGIRPPAGVFSGEPLPPAMPLPLPSPSAPQ
jgi:hypothetical protein